LLEVGEYRVGFDQVFLRFGLNAAGRYALDTVDRDGAGGRNRLLSLRRGDAGTAQGPALRSVVGDARSGALGAETEQAVGTLRHHEARQCQRIDTLLSQVRWELAVEVDDERGGRT
jgi:hypothetical protein